LRFERQKRRSRYVSRHLGDYTYELPEELIAQEPAAARTDSRLMVLERESGKIHHARFRDLPDWLPADGLLVVNDTRVVPVRLLGRRSSGGVVETFILSPPSPDSGPGPYESECLTRPARRLTLGTELDYGLGLTGRVMEVKPEGRRIIRFDFPASPLQVIEDLGRMPLPPYIKRRGATDDDDRMDRERYQTVYAKTPGAVAAPTAGLHFDDHVLARLGDKGMEITALTLHVGYGTFAPVREEDITLHRIHSERVTVPHVAADAVNRVHAEGRDVVAVGTTVVRSLEFAASDDGYVSAVDADCELFIYPGYKFKAVDRLITNFHLPGSTLIMLVSALAGREFVMEAYRQAVAERYRFYSYGDAMLVL
jgi:S-adenosylmethionine:tRNA ribosyltransferase-isomerase